ncbi:MAG: MFS transporter [Anaerolineae bacterium]
MKRELRWYDYVTTNIYFLGLSVSNQTLLPLVLPLLVQQFVGEEQQGTYFGVLRLWGLMVALLAQALWGMLSDRTRLRWGRRRPYIFFGTLGDLVFVAGIVASLTMVGMAGFWFLFVVYLGLQIASNAAQAAAQALIPDLIPEAKRGRFSGVKALFEVPLPVLLVSFAIAPLLGQGNTLGGLLVMSGVLVTSMLVTLGVPEEPLKREPPPLNWEPFVRLLLMTAIFTAIILGMREGVVTVGHWLERREAARWLLVGGMGAVGLAAMGVCIGLGVWASVRVSIGKTHTGDRRSFIWWVINRLAFLVSATNLSGFVLYFIQTRLGLTRETAAEPAGRVMLVVGVALLLSALPSGWLCDKWGRKRVTGATGLVAALGTLILLLSPSLGAIYVGGAVVGLATGAFYASSWALGTQLVPEEEAARYLGIANLSGAGAGAIGAYLCGPIADYFTRLLPEARGLGYTLIFALFGLLFLGSTISLLPVRVTWSGEASSDSVDLTSSTTL